MRKFTTNPMRMLYIKINENTKEAQALAAYLKTLPFVEFIPKQEEVLTKKQLKDDLRQALQEVKTGKTKPLKDLFNGK